MRIFSFNSFFSFFVGKKALQCASCSLVNEINENNEKNPCNKQRGISLVSLNSFISLFVSTQDRASLLSKITPFAVSFWPVFAFHIPALFRRASIPVVPTGYNGSWRVTAVPSTPERAKP